MSMRQSYIGIAKGGTQPNISRENIVNSLLSLFSLKKPSLFLGKEHLNLWNRCNPQRADILLSKVVTTGVPAKVDTDIEISLFVNISLL